MYLYSQFKEWFGDLDVKPEKIEPKFKTLEKSMNDKEIMEEFNPKPITLNELRYVLDKDLLDKSIWYICYIEDKEDVLRSVDVHWGGDGWRVSAYSVEAPDAWRGGFQVLSSNFLSSKALGNSKTLTLIKSKPCKLCKKLIFKRTNEGFKIWLKKQYHKKCFRINKLKNSM